MGTLEETFVVFIAPHQLTNETDHPICQRMPLTIEVNTYLYDQQATESETLRVIALMDLL